MDNRNNPFGLKLVLSEGQTYNLARLYVVLEEDTRMECGFQLYQQNGPCAVLEANMT